MLFQNTRLLITRLFQHTRLLQNTRLVLQRARLQNTKLLERAPTQNNNECNRVVCSTPGTLAMPHNVNLVVDIISVLRPQVQLSCQPGCIHNTRITSQGMARTSTNSSGSPQHHENNKKTSPTSNITSNNPTSKQLPNQTSPTLKHCFVLELQRHGTVKGFVQRLNKQKAHSLSGVTGSP